MIKKKKRELHRFCLFVCSFFFFFPKALGLSYLVEVVDEIQFANASKVLIERLHEVVNCLQDRQFVLVPTHPSDEIQACILSINDFLVLPFDDVAQLSFWWVRKCSIKEEKPKEREMSVHDLFSNLRNKKKRENFEEARRTLLPLCVI